MCGKPPFSHEQFNENSLNSEGGKSPLPLSEVLQQMSIFEELSYKIPWILILSLLTNAYIAMKTVFMR